MLHKKDIRSAFSKIIKTTVAKVSEPGGAVNVTTFGPSFFFFFLSVLYYKR